MSLSVLVDTADFVINLLFKDNPDIELETPIAKLGGCAFFCGLAAVIGGLIMGVVIGIFLGAIGVSNPPGAATAIVIILLFMFFSLLYIYHVGLRVEKERWEEYQEVIRQKPTQQ